MPLPTAYTASPTAPAPPPRTQALLPPAVVMLVFVMVVIAIAGFAFIGGQHTMLATLRTENDAMRDAVAALGRSEAAVLRGLAGEPGAIAEIFRETEGLDMRRRATLDRLAGGGALLDRVAADRSDAAARLAEGDIDGATALLATRQTEMAATELTQLANGAIARGDLRLAQLDADIRLATLAVLVLQVVSGTLAIAAMFFAFRSGAQEAEGRFAALRAADRSREQSARLFEMAGVLQSAVDHTDANQVLKSTVLDLMPGHGGALYVFNGAGDRLVRSASWGRDDATLPDTMTPDSCWAIKRGKPQLNRAGGDGLCCAHHAAGAVTVLEIPMVARGEAMGLLQLFADGPNAVERLEALTGLASAIADGMSLALANMALREKLKSQALRDPLTGVYNRRYMEDSLHRFVRLAEREHRELALVMVDFDHFKSLNDQHGHAFGDAVLRDAAKAIVGALRATDIVCRYGGEELVIILPDCGLDAAVEKAEDLRRRIEALGGTLGASVTASFGVAAVPHTSVGVTDLLGAADGALYRAKQNGRNQVAAAIMQSLSIAQRKRLQAAE